MPRNGHRPAAVAPVDGQGGGGRVLAGVRVIGIPCDHRCKGSNATLADRHHPVGPPAQADRGRRC